MNIIRAVSVLGVASAAQAGTPSYQAVVLADAPIVYYEFDETHGTTAATSATTGGTYTGTFNTGGGPVTGGQASFAQGGTAFDSGGGFIGAASALTTSSLDEWTVETWVNYDSTKTSASNFLSNDQDGWNDDVLIGIGVESGSVGVPAGSVGLVHQGSPGSVRETVSGTIDSGQWYHVAMTGSALAGALTLYIDGAFAASNDSLTNGITFNGADGFGASPNLTIGAARPDSADAGYRPYDGLLDELAIYDSVLDAGTIASHHSNGVSESFEVIITPNAETPGNYDFAWDSQGGKVYDLVSTTDLSMPPAGWPVYMGHEKIDGNTLEDAPGSGTERFFAVVEKGPLPLFSENFEPVEGGETGEGGFTATGTPNDWAWGTPNSNNAAGLELTTGNGASQNCWGTSLGDGSGPPSGVIDTAADSILRSPDINLTGISGAQLQFAAAIDALGADTLEVLIREAGTDTQLGSTIVPVTLPASANWAKLGPFDLSAVDNKNVYLEFRFKGTDGTYIGFYIDDVVVTQN